MKALFPTIIASQLVRSARADTGRIGQGQGAASPALPMGTPHQSAAEPAMSSQRAHESPPFYLLVTFWGKEFLDFTCTYALASLLSPDNIPALANIERCRFLFCVPKADWDALQDEPIFQRLKTKIEPVFIQNEEAFPGEHKYVRMSRGHAILTQRCFDDGAVAININPDSIYPDGVISEAARLIGHGKAVLWCAAVRFEMEGVAAALRSRDLLAPGQPFALSKRDAVSMALANLHGETAASDWEAPNFGRLARPHGRRHFLTCCFWRVPGETGLILVTHNWAPFAIDYRALIRHDTSTLDGRALDGNYIYENFSDDSLGERVHVVEDSDSIFLLGLTPREEMAPPNDRVWWRNWGPVRELGRGFILNRTVFDPGIDTLRRKAYRIPVRWHAKDINANWAETEREAARLIDAYVRDDLFAGPAPGWRAKARRMWWRALKVCHVL